MLTHTDGFTHDSWKARNESASSVCEALAVLAEYTERVEQVKDQVLSAIGVGLGLGAQFLLDRSLAENGVVVVVVLLMVMVCVCVCVCGGWGGGHEEYSLPCTNRHRENNDTLRLIEYRSLGRYM
jgi:hypothetical protein